MKQHSTKRRVLSILLSAMMLLSMIPAAVFQSSAAAWEGNDPDPGWHIYADSVTDANWDWEKSVKYIKSLLNAPGNFVNASDWYLPNHDRETQGKSFIAVLDNNVMAPSTTWDDGSRNDGNNEGYYTGLNVPLYAQFNNHMYTVQSSYIIRLVADDFNLTFQGPGTVMGQKDDAAILIEKGHMSFTDGLVVTNTGDVAIDVKSGGVIDLISDATIGAEGSQIGLRNEGTITSITGGTFYNFDNKGTVGSITGGTFDYSQAPEGVSFESIRSAVAENAEIEEIDTGVFRVTSTEEPEPEPEPDPEDPNWDYVDSGRGDGSVVITAYKGAATELVVPAEVQGHKVVGLANGALYGPSYSQYFTSITISEGIEFLGDAAVMFNGSLTSLTLPSTLTTVGDDCFALSSVLQNVDLPAACVNFVDDPDYDCPLNGATNNGLGIFYGLGASVAPATVTCYTEAAKTELENGNDINISFGNPTYNINYIAPVVPVTVTFDANGGENAPAAVEVNANEAYTLPGAGEMTRENYIFAGWALSADATAEDVVTEITPTQATTVYAVWTKAPKDGGANVGTVAPGAPVVLNGSQFKTIGKANWGEEDTSNLMTRDVTFEMVDGKLQVVAVVYDEDLVTVNRPDWAEWETECFELMIDPYNTYTPADYAAAYRDNLIQLRINTAGRLSGRWMAETIGGVADSELPTESAFDGKFQGTVAIDGAWLTYTFVVDLSEFGIEEGNAIGFDAHAVSCPDPEQSGWQYTSYYIKADGTCSGDDGQNVWEANKWDYLTLSYVEAPATVTVTFDANGGENAPAAVEVPLNEVYTLPGAGEMTRENYTFAGWALSADATAEDVVTEITPTESMTVYAVWTEVTAPCEHPEDQRRLVVDTEPGYYFHGVGHIVCDECGATIEEDVDIEPLPLTDAYNDVNPDGWYVPGVAMMTDLGIMSGKGDGIFDPDGTMLRSEMAMTMYQMLADPEEDLSDVELPFTDVSEDHWAINAIKWCYKHGIVSGATPTTFEPDSQILREQFVSMFYRYMVSEMTEEEYQEMVAGIDQTILDQFPDGAAIDDYAVEAMQVFVQAGVITGSDGMLAARGACSRGQVAQILRTILELGMA